MHTAEHKRTRAADGKVSGRYCPDVRRPAADRVVDRDCVGRNQLRDSIRCVDRHADRHRRDRLTARRSVVSRYDTEIDYRRRESDGALIVLGTPVAVRVQIRVVVGGAIVDRVRTVRRQRQGVRRKAVGPGLFERRRHRAAGDNVVAVDVSALAHDQSRLRRGGRVRRYREHTGSDRRDLEGIAVIGATENLNRVVDFKVGKTVARVGNGTSGIKIHCLVVRPQVVRRRANHGHGVRCLGSD